MTQAELAEEAGVSITTVQNIELGKNGTSAKAALANACHRPFWAFDEAARADERREAITLEPELVTLGPPIGTIAHLCTDDEWLSMRDERERQRLVAVFHQAVEEAGDMPSGADRDAAEAARWLRGTWFRMRGLKSAGGKP